MLDSANEDAEIRERLQLENSQLKNMMNESDMAKIINEQNLKIKNLDS